MLSQDLVLRMVESWDGGDPFAPGLYIECGGVSFASFKVESLYAPSSDEICARMAATDPELMLLSYDEEGRSGLIAVVDFDPPNAGQRLALLPARLPRKINIVWEKSTLETQLIAVDQLCLRSPNATSVCKE
ncbi:hypothetical protein [Pseudomonas savastanoi]|uniref:hypothetical protein n=1 Tax=Pseudomonas savastanoi TaxID=29438 RepID=UPI00177F6B32|nr:hypothetical protein [Pseudomonas savastanoi]QOI07959.1 hypothetical protein D5S10_30005 [Pseudomonas savastanoi]